MWAGERSSGSRPSKLLPAATPCGRSSGGFPAVDESVRRVAARIRAWRGEAGLSLQELANRSGVSPSTIHKIEHGQTVPTIAVVLKLVVGLGRRAAELFDDGPRRPAATLVRATDRWELTTTEGVVLQALAGDPAARDMGVWRVVHPPGFSFGGRTMRHGDGEMVIYLERGDLAVRVEDDEFTLRAGDTLHFKASSPHAWRNDGAEEAVAIVLGQTTGTGRSALLARLRRLGLEPDAAWHRAGAREPLLASA